MIYMTQVGRHWKKGRGPRPRAPPPGPCASLYSMCARPTPRDARMCTPWRRCAYLNMGVSYLAMIFWGEENFEETITFPQSIKAEKIKKKKKEREELTENRVHKNREVQNSFFRLFKILVQISFLSNHQHNAKVRFHCRQNPTN